MNQHNQEKDAPRRRTRLHPSLTMDHIGAMEHYYTREAQKGWVLERAGNTFDSFVWAKPGPGGLLFRAEPCLNTEEQKEGPAFDRRQFYADAGWVYRGTGEGLHFYSSEQAAADAELLELHTDPQDFAPALRRQYCQNFFALLLCFLLGGWALWTVGSIYPPRPSFWLSFWVLLAMLCLLLPGLIKDGLWLARRRWQNLPPVDHNAPIPRAIAWRSRIFSCAMVIVFTLLFRLGFDGLGDRIDSRWLPLDQLPAQQRVLSLQLTDGDGLTPLTEGLTAGLQHCNQYQALTTLTGCRFLQLEEGARTADGRQVLLTLDRASCRSEGQARRMLARMQKAYDWAGPPTALSCPGLDEASRCGDLPVFFVRRGKVSLLVFYNGALTDQQLLELLARQLAAQESA